MATAAAGSAVQAAASTTAPAAAAAAAAASAAWGGRRRLKQDSLIQLTVAAPRCLDGNEPDEAKAVCVACHSLQLNKTNQCLPWVDRIAMYFPRGSTQPPSPDQQAAAMEGLCSSGMPSTGCCEAIAACFAARCGCDSGFMLVREEAVLEAPMLTVAYIQGSNLLLATACGLEDLECP